MNKSTEPPKTKTDKIVHIICQAVRVGNTKALEAVAASCDLTHKQITELSDALETKVHKKQADPLAKHRKVLSKNAIKYGSVYAFRDANPAQRPALIFSLLKKGVADKLSMVITGRDALNNSMQISSQHPDVLTGVRKALWAVGFHTKTEGGTVTISQ